MSRIPEGELLTVLFCTPKQRPEPGGGHNATDILVAMRVQASKRGAALCQYPARGRGQEWVRYRLGLLEQRGLVQRERDLYNSWVWWWTEAAYEVGFPEEWGGGS